MEDDWDLHAVVRGCAALAAATGSNKSQESRNTLQQDSTFSTSSFQDLFEPTRSNSVPEELHDIYKPFFPNSEILFSLPIPPLPVLGGSPSEPPPPPPPILKPLHQKTPLRQKQQQSFSVSTGSRISIAHNPTPRSKRRKSHSKRVCHVAAENLSSDVWSWRKYGQKPIKGSPYPRGYYRCSTSKGCMARKQVERNRSDPGMFIVTYTAEHNHPTPTHRNSLAGSTRQKPPEAATPLDPEKPSCSPELSPAVSLSPAPEKMESSREDTDDDDDLFAGLEDFAAGEYTSSDHSPASLQFPWISTIATTTAGGG